MYQKLVSLIIANKHLLISANHDLLDNKVEIKFMYAMTRFKKIVSLLDKAGIPYEDADEGVITVTLSPSDEEAISIKTSDFKPIENSPIGLGARHLEWDENLSIMLNKLIEDKAPINSPVQLTLDHDDMVEAGFIKDHGGNKYSLTLKSIVLLKEYQDGIG